MTYAFNEDLILEEVRQYVDDTYNGHYSQTKFQTNEFIIDNGHGKGFVLGNIIKYAQRYGKKGNPADHRKDLMKILHYGIIAIHNHDKEMENEDKR